MVLRKEQYDEIRDALDNCKRPLFFFDDDPDGTCAFLLLYRYKREGKGVPVKSSPNLTTQFLPKVQEYQPDLIVVLDKPLIDQDFLDGVSCPVIWIDHHGHCKREKVKYYNPRDNDPTDITSTTINAYYVAQRKEDLWLGMMGGVGDWQLPPFTQEFCERYPDLLDSKVKRPQDALFGSELGRLIKILSFVIKGKTGEVMKCIKIMTRIKSPHEILRGETSQGRYIMKRAREIEERYDEILKEACKRKTKDKLLIFTYTDDKMSFTKEMSNELLYRYPDKIIVMGREKGGDLKLSLRSTDLIIPPVLQKALEGVEGYGGGHEHACGANVKAEQFERFIEQFRAAMAPKKEKKERRAKGR
jgi:single-stranded DNA-specific DHH superfamily exonuclease